MTDVPLTTVTVLAIGATAGEEISCEVQSASIRHGRDDTDSQPEASTVSLDLPLGMAASIDIGARLSLTTGIAQRFVGKVTDMAISWATRWDPDVGAYDVAPVAQVQAAGPLAELGARYMGDTPWPAELDGARAARILGLVGGRVQDWSYNGTAPDGWWDQWLGVPGAASLTADPTGLRITWHPGSVRADGFSWRYATPLVQGKSYSIVAEVYVPTGQPGIRMAVMPDFMGQPITPADRWQTIVTQFVAASNADRSIGPKITVDNAARPAGQYCLVRRFQVFADDAPAIGIVDPGRVNVLARDVDRQPALDLLQSLANDAAGVAWETRDGLLSYADNEHRRNIAASITLEACDVLMAPVWTRSKAGLVNEVAIGYGVPATEGADQPVYTASNPGSLASYGRYAFSASTQLAALADATAMGQLLVSRNSRPVWVLEAIELDLSVLTPAQQLAVLALDMHDLITITGFPAGGPETTTSLWVEGWQEEIEHGSHRLQLAVSGYCRTAPPPMWDELPSTLTWDQVDAGFTWDSVYCIGPTPSEGRWNDVSASLRWDQISSSITWDTWPY